MKKLVLFLSIVSLNLSAISAKNNVNGTIYIESSRLMSPLIEQWVNEYEKTNPQINFELADEKIDADDISLKLITVKSGNANSLQDYEKILIFGRSAILPVTGKENPLIDEFSKKRLDKKKIKDLFFEKDSSDDEEGSSKKTYTSTVYSGISETSVANSFAAYFGYTSSKLKGKKIVGDDVYLIQAIQRDKDGITINSLSNIFDIKTRKLKDNVTILPLDIDKKYREYLTESAVIDDVIELLESTSIDLIPVESIGFVYDSNNESITDFLEWVLTEGKKYNHNFGLLIPDEKVLAHQIKDLNKSKALTQR
jgi:ABC-type phosphate transport system substrate-binding protein